MKKPKMKKRYTVYMTVYVDDVEVPQKPEPSVDRQNDGDDQGSKAGVSKKEVPFHRRYRGKDGRSRKAHVA